MGREKKPRTPVQSPPATPEGWGSFGGMEGAYHNDYTVVYTRAASDDPILDMHVRPRSRAKGGATVPTLGHLKITENILVEDAPTSSNPILSKGVIAVVDKKRMTDAVGDYALIRVKPDRSFGDLPGFFQKYGAQVFPVQVTVYVDLGGLVGGAAGIGIPAGALSVPVKGQSGLHLRMTELKVRIRKTMWKDAGEIDVTALPGVDNAALADLSRRGGTLQVCLDGGIKLSDSIARWNEGPFVDAEVTLVGTSAGDVRATYRPDDDVYELQMSSAAGEPTSPYAPKAKAQVRVEVWPDDQIEALFKELGSRTSDNDVALDTNGALMQAAENFTQTCVDYLAKTSSSDLQQNAARFTNATNAVTYFQGFTRTTAKAFRTALDLHKDCYERYMENLVAGMMEIFFFLGEDFFKKVFNKVMKNGAQAAEKQLQSEVKTLGHEAAEEAEGALLAKKQAAEQVRAQIESEIKPFEETAKQNLEASGRLVGPALEQQGRIVEKNSLKKSLEDDIEKLARSARDPATIKPELQAVEKELAQLDESLKADRQLLNNIAKEPAQDNPMHAAWQQARNDLDNRVKSAEARQAEQLLKQQELQNAQQLLNDLAAKRTALDEMVKDIEKLQQTVDGTLQQMETLDAQAKAALTRLNEKAADLMSAEAELEVIEPQLKGMQNLKAQRGTAEEFKQAVDSALRDVPGADRLPAMVFAKFEKRFSDIKKIADLEALIAKCEEVPTGLDSPSLQKSRQALAKMLRKQLEQVKGLGVQQAEATSHTILEQYASFVPDIIKGKFNERATKLRQALLDYTHIDYKAQPGKFYQEDYGVVAGWVLGQVDALVEATASVWNWFCSTVSELVNRKEYSGPIQFMLAKLLKMFGDFSFGFLTVMLLFLDLLLWLLTKFLEGVLYLANHVPTSLLSPNSCSLAEGGPHMPVPFPPELVKCPEAVAKVGDGLHPRKIADRADGKAAAIASLKQEFSGAYKEYYEAQWKTVETYMASMAGASGALDPKWIESDAPRSTNRDATKLLASILGPLRNYETTMKRPVDRDLATIFADVAWGDWSAADFDKGFELIGNAVSLLLKFIGCAMLIGGVVLGFVGVTAPVGVAMVSAGGSLMAFSGPSDRFWAALRVGTVAMLVMPQILGAKFDVMRVYSLAYMSIFDNLDISPALNYPATGGDVTYVQGVPGVSGGD